MVPCCLSPHSSPWQCCETLLPVWGSSRPIKLFINAEPAQPTNVHAHTGTSQRHSQMQPRLVHVHFETVAHPLKRVAHSSAVFLYSSIHSLTYAPRLSERDTDIKTDLMEGMGETRDGSMRAHRRLLPTWGRVSWPPKGKDYLTKTKHGQRHRDVKKHLRRQRKNVRW